MLVLVLASAETDTDPGGKLRVETASKNQMSETLRLQGRKKGGGATPISTIRLVLISLDALTPFDMSHVRTLLQYYVQQLLKGTSGI